MEKVTKLQLPNTLGSEKIAMEKVTSVAKSMGFENERIEDLKTATAEACTNAMEHGNNFDQSTTVGVILLQMTAHSRFSCETMEMVLIQIKSQKK